MFENNSHEAAKSKLESMQIAAKQKKKAAEQAKVSRQHKKTQKMESSQPVRQELPSDIEVLRPSGPSRCIRNDPEIGSRH